MLAGWHLSSPLTWDTGGRDGRRDWDVRAGRRRRPGARGAGGRRHRRRRRRPPATARPADAAASNLPLGGRQPLPMRLENYIIEIHLVCVCTHPELTNFPSSSLQSIFQRPTFFQTGFVCCDTRINCVTRVTPKMWPSCVMDDIFLHLTYFHINFVAMNVKKYQKKLHYFRQNHLKSVIKSFK